MIQGSKATLQITAGWREVLASAITDPAELLQRLDLPMTLLPAAEQAAKHFGLKVTAPYLARIRPADPADPLLRQVLPISAELDEKQGFSSDPVGDLAAMQSPGLLHKYHGRALLLATPACGIHCRYCFRRTFPYTDANPARNDWQQALASIEADPSLTEIILSGGDPLSLSDQRLDALNRKLADIPHIKRLRIHTRLPVVAPSRIDEALCTWLANSRLQTVVVLHINHPREIDTEVARACDRLRDTGATLLNQAVLLAGVNDDVATQIGLSERLFEAGVLPYYLHQLDRVVGAAHFEVSDAQACQLLGSLREALPGYLVPRLVREEAGGSSKHPLQALPETSSQGR
jgi:EF-P beta-lysylation protein EpmB